MRDLDLTTVTGVSNLDIVHCPLPKFAGVLDTFIVHAKVTYRSEYCRKMIPSCNITFLTAPLETSLSLAPVLSGSGDSLSQSLKRFIKGQMIEEH